jgi:hypothetical protein
MKTQARRGDWVRVHRIILEPHERAPNLPADTQSTPFQAWTNGFLEDESAAIGDEATIRTVIGRLVTGRLTDANPRYAHDFGNPQPELLAAGDELRSRFHRS